MLLVGFSCLQGRISVSINSCKKKKFQIGEFSNTPPHFDNHILKRDSIYIFKVKSSRKYASCPVLQSNYLYIFELAPSSKYVSSNCAIDIGMN